MVTTTSAGVQLSERISDSGSENDSDDDFNLDVLSMLTNNRKSTSSVEELHSKRPGLFENDRKTGLKKLIKAPSTVLPPFFLKSSVSVLQESNKLAELHAKDESEALRLLQDEDEIKQKIRNSLSSDALKNDSYAKYISMNHDNLRLYDFHYLGVPKYVKAVETDPVEFLTIYNGKKNFKGDLYNLLDEGYIQNLNFTPLKEAQNDELEIEAFLQNIGVSEDQLKLERIDEGTLSIDPKLNLQPIRLIILKLSRFVEYLTTTNYSDLKFNKIIKHLGFLMIDLKIYNAGNSTLFSSAINSLIKWAYQSTRQYKLNKVIDIWNSITTNNQFLSRIIDSLDGTTSALIHQLKLQLTISILNIAPFEFRYFKNIEDLRTLINNVLLKELKQLTAIDYSDDELCDYVSLRVKFQSVVLLLDLGDESDTILKSIKLVILELQRKIPQSLSNADLSLLRSVVVMISNML